MKESQDESPLKPSFNEMLEAFKHWKSLSLIGLITSILAFQVPWGVININAPSIASSIFQVAGTMVALVLPAAEISNHFISKLANDLLATIIAERVDDDLTRETVQRFTKELRVNMYPAWRASVYALCSFILSSMAMISPPKTFPIFSPCLALSVDYLLVGASLGFLVMAGIWFFPTARYAFRLGLLNFIEADIERRYPSKKTVTEEQRRMKPDTHSAKEQLPKEDLENHPPNDQT